MGGHNENIYEDSKQWKEIIELHRQNLNTNLQLSVAYLE